MSLTMEAFNPTVAVICPLPIELDAVLAVFDDHPQVLEGLPYYYGTISRHSAVAVCLPKIGILPARDCGALLKDRFPSIQYRFLVGIAGGIPDEKNDVRLGDVVIGTCLYKHDAGKWWNGDLRPSLLLKEAPQKLLEVIPIFKTRPQQRPDQLLEEQLENMRIRNPERRTHWTYPDAEEARDLLFTPSYTCLTPSQDQCSCDPTQIIGRVNRPLQSPKVHYGLIASGDQVMKDAMKRDKVKNTIKNFLREDVLAVEMEAAALYDLGYMVVRGICDYADSHKNKKWQDYAAATAAACFKTLLCLFPTPNNIPPNDHRSQTEATVPDPISTSAPGTSSRPSWAQPTSTVDMELIGPGPGNGFLHNHAHNNSAQGPATGSSNFAGGSMLRSDTHGRILGTQGENSDPGELFFRRTPPITTDFPQSSMTDDLCSSPVAESPAQLGNTLRRISKLPSGEANRDLSPHSTSSNPIPANITSETRNMDSLPERHSWTWPLSAYHWKSTTEQQNESPMGGAADLKLIQYGIYNEPLKTTWTIEIHDTSQRENPFVFWLPLDEIRVSVQLGEAQLQYSDCKARAWRSVDGRGEHYSKYNAISPNISAVLNFLDSKSAEGFANLILHIDCTLLGSHHLESFPTLDGICIYGTARGTANELDTSDQSQQCANIIISIEKLDDPKASRISKVFGLGSRLDYELKTSQGVITICLGQLRKAAYETPAKTAANWPPHWVRENRDGRPDRLVYHDSMDVAVKFSEHVNDGSPWKAFMEGITGWQIQSWDNAQMRGHHAQMVVWSKGSELRVLCKAQVHTSERKWYCLDLSRGQVKKEVSVNYDGRGKTVTLKHVLFSDGKHIARSMTTERAQGARQDKISDEKLKFPDRGKAHDFEIQIRKLLAQSSPRLSMEIERSHGSSRSLSSMFSMRRVQTHQDT